MHTLESPYGAPSQLTIELLMIIKIWNGNANRGEFDHDLSSNQ